MGVRGRAAKATNRKQGGFAALNPATFPKSVAWRVDQDYLGSLSKDEKGWLAEFNDRYYGADFRGESVQRWSTEQRREVYRDKNRANRDLMTCAAFSEETMSAPESVDFDELPVDDTTYLDCAEYKAAREAYRLDPSPDKRVRLNQTRKKHRR